MQDNRYSLNRTLGLAIAAIALVALLGSGGVLLTLGQLREATARRYHAAQVIAGLGAFRTAMLDQQTGVRGYFLTADQDNLKPYRAGRVALDRAIRDVRVLVADDPRELALVAEAERVARGWQASTEASLARALAEPSAARRTALVAAGGGNRVRFDAFRVRLGVVEAIERAGLPRQNRVVEQAQRTAELALWTSLLVTLAICVAAALIISRVVTRPLVKLADTVRRLVLRDTAVTIPSVRQRNEVGAIARAVAVFRDSLVELDRTSVLRVTADTMPAMIGYLGADRRIGFLNEEFGRRFDLAEADVGQLTGRPVDEVFARGSFPGIADLPRALAGEEVRFAFQLGDGETLRDHEGTLRPHRAPGGPGEGGRVLGVVALFTDVTDRKQIDRQLRHQAHDLQRSNEELEQFAYVASHDLKAPLRGIENLASWIEEDLGDKLDGDTRTNMDLLRSRVRRLESLLSDLLAYSRAGRGDNVVREVDTAGLVDELAVLVAPPEGFRIEADPSLPTLRAAQAPLAQVLQNLIGNAIKHHPDPARGLIRVKADRRDHLYAFTVSDNGAGIPEQFRERVFGMFQTLRPRDEVEGSGMGLAIVRKLVERQAGTVWLAGGDAGGLDVHFTWPVDPKERA